MRESAHPRPAHLGQHWHVQELGRGPVQGVLGQAVYRSKGDGRREGSQRHNPTRSECCETGRKSTWAAVSAKAVPGANRENTPRIARMATSAPSRTVAYIQGRRDAGMDAKNRASLAVSATVCPAVVMPNTANATHFDVAADTDFEDRAAMDSLLEGRTPWKIHHGAVREYRVQQQHL